MPKSGSGQKYLFTATYLKVCKSHNKNEQDIYEFDTHLNCI